MGKRWWATVRQRSSKAWRHITSSAPSPLWPAVLCAAVKKLPSDSTIFKIVHSTQFCVTHNKHCLLWWTLNTVNKPAAFLHKMDREDCTRRKKSVVKWLCAAVDFLVQTLACVPATDTIAGHRMDGARRKTKGKQDTHAALTSPSNKNKRHWTNEFRE